MYIVDNKIPLIHTMESDMDNFSQNENSPVLAAQQQLENRILPPTDDTSASKWKLLLRVFLIILVLVVVGFTAYKLTTGKTAAPVAKVVVKAKVWGVSDVWPSMSMTLASSTGEATSSTSFVLITINDFNSAYESITQNEDKINEMTGKYFGIFDLSTFTTQQINNVDLHVSDGGDKPVVYGYAGQKYFILTTSIADFFKIYEKLGGNAGKSS